MVIGAGVVEELVVNGRFSMGGFVLVVELEDDGGGGCT